MKTQEEMKRWAEAMAARDKVFRPTVTEEQVKTKGFFWCCRNAEQVHSEVCINRQENEKEGCIRCQQGTLVKRVTIEKLQSSRPKRHRTI